MAQHCFAFYVIMCYLRLAVDSVSNNLAMRLRCGRATCSISPFDDAVIAIVDRPSRMIVEPAGVRLSPDSLTSTTSGIPLSLSLGNRLRTDRQLGNVSRKLSHTDVAYLPRPAFGI